MYVYNWLFCLGLNFKYIFHVNVKLKIRKLMWKVQNNYHFRGKQSFFDEILYFIVNYLDRKRINFFYNV